MGKESSSVKVKLSPFVEGIRISHVPPRWVGRVAVRGVPVVTTLV